MRCTLVATFAADNPVISATEGWAGGRTARPSANRLRDSRVVSDTVDPRGGAARKVDQYAARKVIQSEGGSFYVFLPAMKMESACGNVEISRSVRDFQAGVEIGL